MPQRPKSATTSALPKCPVPTRYNRPSACFRQGQSSGNSDHLLLVESLQEHTRNAMDK
jgi:hypothetical protein